MLPWTASIAATATSRARNSLPAFATSLQVKNLSSNPGGGGAAGDKIDPEELTTGSFPRFKHKQDFVKERLRPGEWDSERTDPTWNPEWKNKARIISAEDFANRPKVGFSVQFDRLSDGMVTLGWLKQEQRDGIYDDYLQIMRTMSEENEGVTSHEYVMRVLAQKYNISAARVGAIVQLQHNEERIRAEHPERINYKLQEFTDAKFKETIRDTYEDYGETDPEQFIEDPVGIQGKGDQRRLGGWVKSLGDLIDLDEKTRSAIIRERDQAQLSIDNHNYVEDIDDSVREVKLGKESRRVIKSKAVMMKMTPPRRNDQTPFPKNGDGAAGFREDNVWKPMAGKTEDPAHRPQWKFVAKIIDSRKKERRHKFDSRLKRNQDKGPDGTIVVEDDGTLRPATITEAELCSWKSVRNEKEFTYSGVKKAFLETKLKGKSGVWGRAKNVPAEAFEESDEDDNNKDEEKEEGDEKEEKEEAGEENEKETNGNKKEE